MDRWSLRKIVREILFKTSKGLLKIGLKKITFIILKAGSGFRCESITEKGVLRHGDIKQKTIWVTSQINN